MRAALALYSLAAIALLFQWSWGAADIVSSEGLFGTQAWISFLSDTFALAQDSFFLKTLLGFDHFYPWVFGSGYAAALLLLVCNFEQRYHKLLKPLLLVQTLVWVLLHFRYPLLSNSSDLMLGQMGVLLFLLIWQNKKIFQTEHALPSLFVYSLFGVTIYVGSVFYKLQSPHWWPELSALERALRTTDLARPWVSHWVDTPTAILWKAGAAHTLFIEFFAPVAISLCLFLQAKRGKRNWHRVLITVRLFFVLQMILLHVGILATVAIGPFPWICMAYWFAFLFPLSQDRTQIEMKKKAPDSHPGSVPLISKQTFLPFSYLAVCVTVLIGTLWQPTLFLSPNAHFFSYLMNIKQYWSMFSPAPRVSTAYVVRKQIHTGAWKEVSENLMPESYAWWVFWGSYWAGDWGKNLENHLPIAVGEWVCSQRSVLDTQGWPPLQVEVLAVQTPLFLVSISASKELQHPKITRIARAGCPQPSVFP
jgi:hypothetical protein